MGLNAAPDVTYGFVGLGNMGFGMAMNIRVKIPTTSKFVICDTNQARTEEFLGKAGGNTEVAVSPREVAEKADIILTSLPHGPAVHTVYTDPDIGLLSIPKPQSSKLFIELSTTEIGIATDVRNQALESGIGEVIDSPVSGGIASATQGDLTVMIGGTAEQYAKAKPVLEMIGISKHIFHCGPPGHGLATKLINNYCNFINYAVLCEGMNAGVRYGLDPKLLAEVIDVSSGQSFHTLKRNPIKGVHPSSPAERDFKSGFPTELAKGVLDKAVDFMQEAGAKQLFGTVMADIYARAITNEKCAGREHHSIYKLYSEDEGKDLGDVTMQER